jgi:hypothetical protein
MPNCARPEPSVVTVSARSGHPTGSRKKNAAEKNADPFIHEEIATGAPLIALPPSSRSSTTIVRSRAPIVSAIGVRSTKRNPAGDGVPVGPPSPPPPHARANAIESSTAMVPAGSNRRMGRAGSITGIANGGKPRAPERRDSRPPKGEACGRRNIPIAARARNRPGYRAIRRGVCSCRCSGPACRGEATTRPAPATDPPSPRAWPARCSPRRPRPRSRRSPRRTSTDRSASPPAASTASPG